MLPKEEHCRENKHGGIPLRELSNCSISAAARFDPHAKTWIMHSRSLSSGVPLASLPEKRFKVNENNYIHVNIELG
jgi:hypothetical protein